jgi:choline dehydrogenase
MLMVSGIGPRSTLERLDIPVISELSGVGQNLEDHLLFGASHQVKLQTHSALVDSAYYASATREYNNKGTGMLSNPGAELLAWEKVPATNKNNLSASAANVLSSFPNDWPDFEFLMLDAYSGNNENYATGAPNTTHMYASPSAAILVQQSRGTVTIRSKDTAVHPEINPNWLTHPADQELALVGFRRMREMMDTDVMRDVWVEEVLPGRNVSSDEDILNYIRDTGIQLFHAACTCKIFSTLNEAI